jgi:hypothetical protein
MPVVVRFVIPFAEQTSIMALAEAMQLLLNRKAAIEASGG